ncbi:MAG TPA: flagellar basal body P-ring formation chaperone FlgA [Propylenella sp.]|nr:flagellar basal body P-ring formation chaperone FlgA [Propylenella sp.]
MSCHRARRRHIAALSLLLAGVYLGATAALAAGRTLPVPQVTIYPGDPIEPELLVDRTFSAGLIGNMAVIDDRGRLAGKVAKRTLLPGYPIPVNSVEEPNVIAAGIPVRVVFQDGGLRITVLASAMQAGGVGDVISVRNLESGLTLHGVVQADGTVRVGSM